MNDFNFLKTEIEESYMSNEMLLHSSTGDGRLDSAESESVVLAHFQNLFQNTEVKITPAPEQRYWYDLLIEYHGKKYPVNIKITSGSGADNISSKLGLFYTLTGIWPENVKGLNQWRFYNEAITSNFNPNTDGDYYFITYFKEEGIFLFTSLKRINSLTPNGNNLPFQCKWNENCIMAKRDNDEQCEYLINTYYDSWVKKVSGFEPLMNWKNNHI